MSKTHDLKQSSHHRSTLFTQPLTQVVTSVLGDDEIALELDEPPDNQLTNSEHKSTLGGASITEQRKDREYVRQPPTPMERKCSLITQGLLSTTNMQDIHLPPDALMARAGSQASAYSLSSNHGLTSDGGFSSPAHSGTPSPPLPAALQAANVKATKTIKFAGDKTTQLQFNQPPANATSRKACISFACPPARASNVSPPITARVSSEAPRRPCTIRFACSNNPPVASPAKPAASPKKSSPSELHSTPRRGASPFPSSLRRRVSQSNQSGLASDREKFRNTTNSAHSPSELRRLEKQRLKRLGSTRPEDEAWVNEKPKERKPITVTDTLRKENAIRQLAVEAEQEAFEEALDDMVDEEEDDDPATGSRYMAFDEDESDGGHETDDEGGFAESDDDSDDDPDFQFWTARHSTAAAAAASEHRPEIIRPRHERSISESSFDSAFKPDSSSAVPMPSVKPRFPLQRRIPREPKMRPGTPELPDSTDFVCGTLDEDKPLEEAYLSCLKQRKLEKQGIIPQDLDPSFPTSDPENNDDEEDEATEGVASTASDHHFLGGRFDESDSSQHRGRDKDEISNQASQQEQTFRRFSPVHKPRPKSPASTAPFKFNTKPPLPVAMQRVRTKSPAPVAMQRVRTKSPAPVAMQRIRTKSPAPMAMQKVRPKSPAPNALHNAKTTTDAPRNLFGRSPVRLASPFPVQIRSPPASPKNIKIQTSGLAERPGHVKTASLPHTPNPFFVIQERKLRANRRKLADNENHDRGPVDIKQGLEQRKQRRKEHYWRKHCRDHKDKSRRCAPGKGAERMRELGIEMAHRNKAYGQKLQLMLSV